MATLGPFDRRIIRKRCMECTRRKIKCIGGRPCQYCSKMKRECAPQSISSTAEMVFITTSAQPSGAGSHSAICKPAALKIFPQVLGDSSLFINHFFTGFLFRNNFGAPLDFNGIASEFQRSPSLYNALIAVGALDLSRKPHLYIKSKDAGVKAITAYTASIAQFQGEITGSKNLKNLNLWTTLFLGLFELMYDKTGEGWLKHILYGTSKILQLRGPQACLIDPGRGFYLIVRVLEICRSLIYSKPTFLSQPKWKSLMTDFKDQSSFHPKERLFDLMIECSSLNQNVQNLLERDSESIPERSRKLLLRRAAEGLAIRADLNDWYTNFSSLTGEFKRLEKNAESVLATVYFHGISIYLSGIFDYHCQFNSISTPELPRPVIQSHVDVIIATTADAMKTTNLSPALFFFPLRVAGARVTSARETSLILELLQQISKRSFPVADAFTGDLKSLWEWKNIT